MSFMGTLAKVAVGFAAAKGIDKYSKMGGMAGMEDMFRGAAGSGGMVDQIAGMAQKMGMPGGGKAVQDMMGSLGLGGGGANDAAAAGFGGLMSAMGGAAAATGQQMDTVMDGMFANTPASVAAETNAKLMIKAMIQAAKADGEIDPEEQAKILDAVQDAPPEEVAFVREQLAAPVDVASLASEAGENAKAQVYSTSLMAIRVDNEQEATYLRQLSAALGLSDEARDRVHAAMGVPKLS